VEMGEGGYGEERKRKGEMGQESGEGSTWIFVQGRPSS